MEEQKEKQEKSEENMEMPRAIEKVLVFKGERAQMLSVNPDAVAQPAIVGEEKVDVIRDEVKDDINPASLNKETLDLEYDEREEEKSKFFKRKLKKLRRKTVAELQQKVNLKASSSIILLPHHWCFKNKQDKQDKQGIEKPAWKLLDFIKRVGIMKMVEHCEKEMIKRQ
ncbi:hypothetical protein TNCT_180571 [Trichonephila clavata]|uniref:DUF382 domain-containing protein n=1 Tax=Trichonephila clavata TaxID=2740835 RepID=A0A8X6L8Z3_TRICU|nr:hypothetical protein TNCT_180571 [Trichonephila clavata]